jgi:hypothetical protein
MLGKSDDALLFDAKIDFVYKPSHLELTEKMIIVCVKK